MSPKIIAITGPLRGIIFELAAPEILIGRDQDNLIAPTDKSASRRHCLIRHEGEHLVVVDLDSRNGTFVNDVPVKSHGLCHGDRIRVGASHFLVLLRDEEARAAGHEVEFNDDLVTVSLTTFKLEEALYTTTRDLNVLMKLSQTVSSIGAVQPLLRALLDSLFEIVPAERGLVALTGRDPDDLEASLAVDRLGGPADKFRVSRTVATKVLREGVALLSNEVVSDPRLNAESLIGANVSSLICVPLMRPGRINGFVYLDTSRRPSSFAEAELRMVSMIAGIAAGALERAVETERLEAENQRLRSEQRTARNIVGESAQMQAIADLLLRVAPRDSTVLILGESGTGKELAARELHDRSPRAASPFIAVNCASLSETLLESELFGHERGAFTGAIAQKKGKLEVANGGTLFLDEVAEMTPSVQAKLLRVLQDFRFERLGGTRVLQTDVRVIAATNRNLPDEAAAGRFRQDLFYRLNVVQLTMPPLRDRREDIPLLANYFVARYAARCNRRVSGVSSHARRCLLAYDWPGNVRELENAIERAVVLGLSDTVEVEDLPEVIMASGGTKSEGSASSFQALVRQAKREILQRAIQNAGGNHSAAARALGIQPNNLHRLLHGVGLNSSSRES